MSSSLLSTLSASWAELSWLIASLFQFLAVAPMSKRAAQLAQISCKSWKWKWSKVYPVKGNRLSWSWLRNFSALLSRYLAAKQTACFAFSYLWMMYIPCNVAQSELSLGICQAICYCFFPLSQPQSYPTVSSSYHSVNLLNCLPHTQSQLTHTSAHSRTLPHRLRTEFTVVSFFDFPIGIIATHTVSSVLFGSVASSNCIISLSPKWASHTDSIKEGEGEGGHIAGTCCLSVLEK